MPLWIAAAALPPRDGGCRTGTVRTFGHRYYTFAMVALVIEIGYHGSLGFVEAAMDAGEFQDWLGGIGRLSATQPRQAFQELALFEACLSG